MRQSLLFTHTRREAPKDEVAKNASLLIRAGFVHKEMAGLYSLLPLGLRVLEKINTIIREEMNRVGGQEVLLSSFQDKSLWEKTERWESDVWFKTELNGGGKIGLGFTHEEPMTRMMAEHISSYKDLPRLSYQIQTKFRNEPRAKSGILRGREFLMKDLYSFSRDEKEHKGVYERLTGAYWEVFNRAGIGEKTFITFASGGSFSKYSHEFQTLSPGGEDTIFICEKCLTKGNRIAVNKEIAMENKSCPECDTPLSKEEKAIEVGNIFNLGTRFSEPLGLLYKDEKGNRIPVVMGSYGIGPTRLMGTIVELCSDEKGIIWPQSVSPFRIHLLSFGEEGNKEAQKLYDAFLKQGVEVLYDDRDISLGEKFTDSDLIGIPDRILVSDKSLTAGGVEWKKRSGGEARIISTKELLQQFT